MQTYLKSALVVASIFVSSSVYAADNVKTLRFSENHDFTKGQKAMQAGQLKKAVRYFDRSLKANMSANYKIAAYNNLCAVQYAQGLHEKAEKACLSALKLDRKYWRAHVNLGNIKKSAGDIDAARHHYLKAKSVNSSSQIVASALSSISGKQTSQYTENK